MSDQQMKLGDVEKSLGNFEILEIGKLGLLNFGIPISTRE